MGIVQAEKGNSSTSHTQTKKTTPETTTNTTETATGTTITTPLATTVPTETNKGNKIEQDVAMLSADESSAPATNDTNNTNNDNASQGDNVVVDAALTAPPDKGKGSSSLKNTSTTATVTNDNTTTTTAQKQTVPEKTAAKSAVTPTTTTTTTTTSAPLPSSLVPSAATLAAINRKKDQAIWTDIGSMATITKSPYEQYESAEVGEKIFDDVKALLVPRDCADGTTTIDSEASKLFGVTLAESLVVANQQIGKSGMLYSADWQDGKIRGMQCGWIPRALLLLCLHEQRFIKAGEAVLMGIIKDLGVCKIVKDAMAEWKLESDYLNLASCTNFTFTSRKQVCCKCEIFVARAYRCYKALKRTTIDESLLKKVRACLNLMNDHTKVNKRDLEKKKAELEARNRNQNQNQFHSYDPNKRPRLSTDNTTVNGIANNPNAAVSVTETVNGTASASVGNSNNSSNNNSNSNNNSSNNNATSSNSINGGVATGTNGVASGTIGRLQPVSLESASETGSLCHSDKSDSAKSQQKLDDIKPEDRSVDALLSLFEEQHRQLGETLAILRRKIQDEKEFGTREIREEVRAELLQELVRSGYTGVASTSTKN